MRAADLQTVLANTAMVQQIHQQAEHRADNVQHQFVLEGQVVQNQKRQAVVKAEEARAPEVRRDRDRRGRDRSRQGHPGPESPEEEPAGGNSDCGRIVDLRA